jgi:hypothetical protein
MPTQDESIFEGFCDIFVIGTTDFNEDDTVDYERDYSAGSLTYERLIPDLESYDYLGKTIRGSGVRLVPNAKYKLKTRGKSAVPSGVLLSSAEPILRAPFLCSRDYTIEKYFDLPGDEVTDGVYLGFRHDSAIATEPELGLVIFEYNRNRPSFVKAISIFKAVALAAEYVIGYEVQAIDAEFQVLRGEDLTDEESGCPRSAKTAFGKKWAVDLDTLQKINLADW